MAYDRPDEDTNFIAALLKKDEADADVSHLINVVLEVLNMSSATLASDTVAQVKTALDTALSR